MLWTRSSNDSQSVTQEWRRSAVPQEENRHWQHSRLLIQVEMRPKTARRLFFSRTRAKSSAWLSPATSWSYRLEIMGHPSPSFTSPSWLLGLSEGCSHPSENCSVPRVPLGGNLPTKAPSCSDQLSSFIACCSSGKNVLFQDGWPSHQQLLG